MKRRQLHLLIILVVVVISAVYWQFFQPEATSADGVLRVHYIDVGQGDSAFIEFGNGMCMLIDAGEKQYGSTVTSYISELGYNTIDFVVATHPHSDHIGGLAEVLSAFDVGEVFMPKVAHNTSTYEGLLVALSDKNLKATDTRNAIIEAGDAYMVFVAPVGGEYMDTNNWSAVMHLTYGGTSFLFTGDAEAESENQITANIFADVLKVGHHGSSSSTTDTFLHRVSPDYAVISCGTDNSYGHPHDETIDKLTAAGVEILRTDLLGTIVIESDGGKVNVIRD